MLIWLDLASPAYPRTELHERSAHLRIEKSGEIKDYQRADDTASLDLLESQFYLFELSSGDRSVKGLWQYFKLNIKHCINSDIPTRPQKMKLRTHWINIET